jgi:hypothetical protein
LVSILQRYNKYSELPNFFKVYYALKVAIASIHPTNRVDSSDKSHRFIRQIHPIHPTNLSVPKKEQEKASLGNAKKGLTQKAGRPLQKIEIGLPKG